MTDLLLEIGTEEIPAKFMPAALAQLETVAKTKLGEFNIPCGQIRTAGTPRRLTLIVHGVASKQKDKHIESKGPSLKIAFDEGQKPTKAALGFARGQGIDAKDLVVKDGYVYAVLQETGGEVKELLPDILLGIINDLTFPKTMRWGDLEMRFARPIRSILALFGGVVVPLTIAGVASGNVSRGHRFLGEKEVEINTVEDYFLKLEKNFVIADAALRRRLIAEQAQELAASQNGIVDIDDKLLEEVTYLVEYPTAILGHFDEKYLTLPPEAVITPMREHQRYFPVKDKNGKLLPMFITIRCGGAEHLDIVRRGNERVLRARLADARFFFEEDKKIRFSERVDMLKSIVFQEGLGSMYDKTKRLVSLAEYLGQAVKAAPGDIEAAKKGAYLAKADLSTSMVGEFGELQGIMGREYALLNGEEPKVAQTILEHYLPRFAGDKLAESTAGRLVGIADKIDNIVSTFSRGLIPTGSQDPYALRRQALGIVNTLLDAKYNISLEKLIGASLDLLGIDDNQKRQNLLTIISDFFQLRLKNLLADENIRYDIIDAILAAGADDIYDAHLRAKGMSRFIGSCEAASLQKALQALARAGNLAKQAKEETGAIKQDLFATEAEKTLYQAYLAADEKISQVFLTDKNKDYIAALNELLCLAKPIDGFFDAVMVMVEDRPVRQNRLALLQAINCLAAKIADLNKLVHSN